MYITLEEDKPMDKEEVKPTGDSAETEIAATGFTPGEWRVVGGELQYTDEGDLYAIIQTPVAAIDIIAPEVMADQHIANARLIAAAPALYEIVSAIGDRCTNLYAGQRCPAGFKDQKMWCLPCRAVAALALVDGPLNQETK